MLKSLIPWRKGNSNIAVQHDEPTRVKDREDYPLARLRDEFDALMQQFFSERWPSERWPSERWPSGRWPSDLTNGWETPRFGWNGDMGWDDNGKEFVFHAELPGFEPDDFDIKVSGNVLTVRAQHKDEEKDKGGSCYRYGSFSQALTLPYGVDEPRIDARYHSGILEVHIPKDQDVPGKRIDVTSA